MHTHSRGHNLFTIILKVEKTLSIKIVAFVTSKTSKMGLQRITMCQDGSVGNKNIRNVLLPITLLRKISLTQLFAQVKM